MSGDAGFALADAREALELKRYDRYTSRLAWEKRCVTALRARCHAVASERGEMDVPKSSSPPAPSPCGAATPTPRSRKNSGDTTSAGIVGSRIHRFGAWLVDNEALVSSLQAFYSKHNAAKVDDIGGIISHFEGRISDLDGALQLQYGESLASFLPPESKSNYHYDDAASEGTASGEEDDVGVALRKSKTLYLESLKELHLPQREYLYRSRSDSSILGVKQVWMDNLHGTVRFDLSLADNPRTEGGRKRKVSQVSLQAEKAVLLKCRLEGLKIVDKFSPGLVADGKHDNNKGLGKVFELDAVDIDASVEFRLNFYYEGRRWKAAPTYRFELVRLKTNQSFADPIIRTAVNHTLPQVLCRAFESSLPNELGNLMLDPKVMDFNSHNKPMGLALQAEIRITGWPSLAELQIDLCSALNAGSNGRPRFAAESMLRKLSLSHEQLGTLATLNVAMQKKGGAGVRASASSSPSSTTSGRGGGGASLMRAVFGGGANNPSLQAQHTGKDKYRGLFPLPILSLQQLMYLQQGLFLGQLVAINRPPGFYTDEDEGHVSNGETDDEGITASEAEESDGEERVGGDENENVEEGCGTSANRAKSAGRSCSGKGWNEYKDPEDSKEFVSEYARLITCATRAQAEVQEMLDCICDEASVPRWSLAHLADRVESILYRKSISLELHLHAVDLRLNVDVCGEFLEAAFWKALKRRPLSAHRHESALRAIHAGFSKFRISLAAIKALAGSLQLTVTGALTGGKSPAFEFSLKDISTQGVLDIQLGNLRIGGLLDELFVWLDGFLNELHSHGGRRGVHAALERKQSKRALAETKTYLIRHLESLQFFLDCQLSICQDGTLVASLSAQRETPRPALTVHVAGDLREAIRFHERSLQRIDAAKASVNFPFPLAQAEGENSGAISAQDLAQALAEHTDQDGQGIPIPIIDLINVLLDDENISSRRLTKQDAFCICGFAAHAISLVEPNALLHKVNSNVDSEQDTEDEDSSGVDV